MLMSASVPKVSSPAGVALRDCCDAACGMADRTLGSVRRNVRTTVLEARIFAAKGMLSIDRSEASDWATWFNQAGG